MRETVLDTVAETATGARLVLADGSVLSIDAYSETWPIGRVTTGGQVTLADDADADLAEHFRAAADHRDGPIAWCQAAVMSYWRTERASPTDLATSLDGPLDPAWRATWERVARIDSRAARCRPETSVQVCRENARKPELRLRAELVADWASECRVRLLDGNYTFAVAVPRAVAIALFRADAPPSVRHRQGRIERIERNQVTNGQRATIDSGLAAVAETLAPVRYTPDQLTLAKAAEIRSCARTMPDASSSRVRLAVKARLVLAECLAECRETGRLGLPKPHSHSAIRPAIDRLLASVAGDVVPAFVPE